MKKEVLALGMAIMAVAVGFAQSNFEEGMRWSEIGYGTHTPYPEFSTSNFVIKGDTVSNGARALKLYANEGVGSYHLVTLLKQEGSKIYFQSNSKAKDWTLMYDFDLKPGEGCYVASPSYHWSDSYVPRTTYVKCSETGFHEKFDNLACLSIEEYADDSCAEFLGKGYWLTGIGSVNGLLKNCGFGNIGATSKLIFASNGYWETFNTSPSGTAEVIDDFGFIYHIDGLNVTVPPYGNAGGDCKMYTSDGGEVPGEYDSKGVLSFNVPEPGIYILTNEHTTKKILVR